MFCLRCGREIKDEDSQVYCPACLSDMERHPVPQGVPIQLPNRAPAPVLKKTSRKRELKPEEQVIRLRRANRRLALGLLLALLALAAAVFLLLSNPEDPMNPPLGRNFRTSQTDGM